MEGDVTGLQEASGAFLLMPSNQAGFGKRLRPVTWLHYAEQQYSDVSPDVLRREHMVDPMVIDFTGSALPIHILVETSVIRRK